MSNELSRTPPGRADYIPAAIAVCLYTVVVLRTAWISDDAYITFRTVDNFVHGYGLTWNVAERVQAYTHPLWMLLLSGIYALTSEIHFTTILLSVIISVAAVLFFAARVAVSAFPALIGVMIFVFSKAFVDYSTSGLENPLTHLLLLLFLFVYLTRTPDRRTLLWLSVLGGLLTLNRMDAALVVLPPLCFAFFRVRGLRSLGIVVLGFAPLIAWEAFALFYYGSLFPNTAYAKLITGLPAAKLVGQGLLYLLASLKMDPLTMIVVAAGLATPLITRQYRHLPIALSAVLYLAYTVWIGGDFMVGRFLTVPLVIAVALLSRVTPATATGFLMLLLIMVIGLVTTRSPVRSGEDVGVSTGRLIDENGICDERAFYFQGTGLLVATNNVKLPNHAFAREGRRARSSGEAVVASKRIGMFGFFAGPHVHVVDEAGLADPLLARMKPEIDDHWRIGHLWRTIPAGYIETLETGSNRLADRRLAQYYDKIKTITRGYLWDPQRLLEIVKLNFGTYDYLLAAAQSNADAPDAGH